MSAASKISTQVEAIISEDRTKAYLRFPSMNMTPLEPSAMEMICLSAGIEVSDPVVAKISEFIKLCTSGSPPQEDFLIAEATGYDGHDAAFELHSAVTDQKGSESGDLFERFAIHTVKAETSIGTLTPVKPDSGGTDVTGQPLPPRTLREIELDGTVKLSDDGTTVLAAADGVPQFDGQCVKIISIKRVNGDVGNDSGNVQTEQDVIVSGNVTDTYKVESARSIHIEESLHAAQIIAGDNVVVRKGIVGQSKGKVIAKGSVVCQACGSAEVIAEGSVHIAKEAVNSRIYTQGKFEMPTGSLVGGRVHAHIGADVKVLGKDSKSKTVLSVGIDPQVYSRNVLIEEEIVKKKEVLQRVLAVVEPMQADIKRLSPQQKERAMDLVMKVGMAQNEIQALTKKQEDAITQASPPEPAYVMVQEAILPGSTVVFGNVSTEFFKKVAGPVQLVRRGRHVLSIDEKSGTETQLPSGNYQEPLRPA